MAGRRGATVAGGNVFADKMEGFSTGYGLIDMISGVPGMLFPRATIVELFGLKSASKTTLLLETIAFNQMIYPDFKVLYADFERMLRKEFAYLHQLGVDTSEDKFTVIQPTIMEDGCKQIIDAVKANEYDMIIVDTIAAMRPAVEQEKGFAQNKQMGVKAKLMSEFLRNLMAELPADGPAIVFINQEYKDINNSSFIQLYNTPSSDSLAFYAGIRIEVRESTKLKSKRINPYTLEEDDIPYGSIINIKTTKNKVGTPFLASKYIVSYGRGIDIIPSVINAAIIAKTIWNKGASKSSFVFNKANGEEQSVVGMAKLIDYFHNNVDDLVAVGSGINELWANDLKYLKERLARKKDPEDATLSQMYELDDEDEGEGLDLGTGEQVKETGEGMHNINDPSFDNGEAESLDLSAAFGHPTGAVKKKEHAEESSGMGGGLKLNI